MVARSGIFLSAGCLLLLVRIILRLIKKGLRYATRNCQSIRLIEIGQINFTLLEINMITIRCSVSLSDSCSLCSARILFEPTQNCCQTRGFDGKQIRSVVVLRPSNKFHSRAKPTTQCHQGHVAVKGCFFSGGSRKED